MGIKINEPLILLFAIPIVAIVIYFAQTTYSNLSKVRFYVSTISRILLIIFLLLSISGTNLVRVNDKLGVIFLLDVSKSMDGNEEKCFEFINNATKEMKREKDSAGLVVFGADAQIEQPLMNNLRTTKIASKVNNDNTNIAQALRVATASFPTDLQKRIVLITDGKESSYSSVEDIFNEISQLQKHNIEVWVYLIESQKQLPDAIVEKIIVPEQVKVDEKFDLQVKYKLLHNQNANCILRILRNKMLDSEYEVEINPGDGLLTVPYRIKESGGFYTYEVVLEYPDDKLVNNNRAYGYTYAQGKSSVAIIDEKPDEARALVEVLKPAGINASAFHPDELLISTVSFANFDAVIISDASAANFSQEQLKVFKSYVENHGGGFAMLGGERTYAPGGYFETPVEEILPVKMTPKKQKIKSTMTVVICCDQSGSMAAPAGQGVTKMDVANEATCKTISLLSPIDKVGVLYSNGGPHWVFNIQYCKDKEGMFKKVRSQQSHGGGIFVLPTLKSAYKGFEEAKIDTAIRHIILFADADDCDDAGPECIEYVEQLNKKGFTFTTVALGNKESQFTPFLFQLSKAGKGRFYLTDDISKLPAIFTEDIMITSKRGIIEEDFKPKIVSYSPILENINWKEVPILKGYVATEIKPGAEEHIQAPDNFPLFSKWHFGIGRTFAFASDAKGRWAKNWLQWDGFKKFWAQSIRWLKRDFQKNIYQTKMFLEGNKGKIILYAYDENGEPLNFLDLHLNVSSTNADSFVGKMIQKGIGRYECEFEAPAKGVYFATVSDKEKKIVANVGGSISYSPEFLPLEPAIGKLKQLTLKTNGKFIEEPKDIFAHTAKPVKTFQDIWKELLFLALMMLIVDVSARRFSIPSSVLEFFRRIFRRKSTSEKDEKFVDERLERLKEAKLKVKQDVEVIMELKEKIKIKEEKSEITAQEKISEDKKEEIPEKKEDYLSRLLDLKRKSKEK